MVYNITNLSPVYFIDGVSNGILIGVGISVSLILLILAVAGALYACKRFNKK